jgi:hypothetical protein
MSFFKQHLVEVFSRKNKKTKKPNDGWGMLLPGLLMQEKKNRDLKPHAPASPPCGDSGGQP